MIRLAFPTDEHYPYQDDRAISVAMQIVRDFNPHIRIAGSDGLDFYSVSRFDKNPARLKAGGLQEEIDAWKAGQRAWKSAVPEAKAFYLVGNHEDRLRRYIWNHPELYGLEALTLPSLLGLGELGIIWEHDKGENANLELSLMSRLLVKHGAYVRKFSAYSAKAELENEFHTLSVLTGHTHRGGSYYVTHRGGLVQAHECFCLCGLEPEYMSHPNWQQGITLATVTPAGVSIEQIPFFRQLGKVKAIWRGKEYIEE